MKALFWWRTRARLAAVEAELAEMAVRVKALERLTYVNPDIAGPAARERRLARAPGQARG